VVLLPKADKLFFWRVFCWRVVLTAGGLAAVDTRCSNWAGNTFLVAPLVVCTVDANERDVIIRVEMVYPPTPLPPPQE
jgi:hypothetical protein